MRCKQECLALHETGGVKAATAKCNDSEKYLALLSLTSRFRARSAQKLSELTGPKEPEM